MSHPVSRPDRPDHEHPWAMQLVIQRDKQHPANHIDVLEAAASAVVGLLDDPRTTSVDGAWAEAVAHWRAGWIRKVARRAENKRWDDVQALDGVTVASGSAAVRAFVPGPVAPLPPQLKKLQVGGTELPRLHASTQDDAVVTIELNPDVELSTGKAAAQVGHAGQLAYERLIASADDDAHARAVLESWRADEFRVRVQVPTPDQWAQADHPVRVVDAGLTEIAQETETARAFW
ncbi:peptidyl-tRNA hydrolase [Enteractinococcus fodinae]|uniref:peptidyl-tRNA hydrolase n=1 Tax=Enteractinococcus fodinae TaxID=684663 RepID=A0ABU2AY42_9MICC|nr:peptidyl-tRNA hydrolase [Enteractinococcus fodinae]MDR7346266.1 peptidyl-tRNA hydrolase [Enteractinococcus fodinae]